MKIMKRKLKIRAKRSASANGARSRKKGHGFEREIAIALRPYFPNAKRQLEYQLDTCLGVDIANVEPFKIQCKKLATYASINRISEIQCRPELGDIPVLITAGDNLPPMAVLSFEDFLNLVSKRQYCLMLEAKLMSTFSKEDTRDLFESSGGE